MPKQRLTNEHGFTLIELMITVAVVGILAAIVYPSYSEQVQKSRRTDAQAVLLQNAQFMERIYTETGCYNPGADDDCTTAGDAGVTLPNTESPIDGATKYYDHTVQNLTQTTFTLQAAPKGAQAGDLCGNLTMNQVGQKAPSTNDCWRK